MAAPKSTADRRLERTAYHEAGHAVASYFLHVKIKAVTIIPSEETLGQLTHPPLHFGRQGVFDDSVRGINRAERHVIVLLAGPLAERKFAPHSRWRLHAGSDFDSMGELFGRIQGEDDEAATLYGRLLWRRAQRLVELRWKDIGAVAQALLEHKRLDAAGVDTAICRAHGLKPLTLAARGRG